MQPVPVVIGQMSLFVPIFMLREIMDLEYKAVCSEFWKNKDRADVSENVVNYHFIRSQGSGQGGQSHGDTIYLLFDHSREFV